jgi:hypothetical protein
MAAAPTRIAGITRGIAQAVLPLRVAPRTSTSPGGRATRRLIARKRRIVRAIARKRGLRTAVGESVAQRPGMGRGRGVPASPRQGSW